MHQCVDMTAKACDALFVVKHNCKHREAKTVSVYRVRVKQVFSPSIEITREMDVFVEADTEEEARDYADELADDGGLTKDNSAVKAVYFSGKNWPSPATLHSAYMNNANFTEDFYESSTRIVNTPYEARTQPYEDS